MQPFSIVAAKGSVRQAVRSPVPTVSMWELNTTQGEPSPSRAIRLAIGGVRMGRETWKQAALKCAPAASQIARVSPGGVTEGIAISSARSACSDSAMDCSVAVMVTLLRRLG